MSIESTPQTDGMGRYYRKWKAAQKSEESAQQSLQQLKAEIAALESRLRVVGCVSAEDTEELCSICAEMRQLSAI